MSTHMILIHPDGTIEPQSTTLPADPNPTLKAIIGSEPLSSRPFTVNGRPLMAWSSIVALADPAPTLLEQLDLGPNYPLAYGTLHGVCVVAAPPTVSNPEPLEDLLAQLRRSRTNAGFY